MPAFLLSQRALQIKSPCLGSRPDSRLQGACKVSGLTRGRERFSLRARAAAEDRSEDASSKKEDKDDDDLPVPDEQLQNALASQIKYQIKLEQAKEFLDEKAEEFKEQGEEGKAKLEEEAKLAGDRVGLELGYAASEIDDSLADLLEETEAAKERNRKIKEEIANLEEELLGTRSGRWGPKEKPKNEPPPISSLKQQAIDKEVEDVDARMKKTLEETQRKTSYTLVLVLLGISDISMLAEGAFDKFFAITIAMGIIFFQLRKENEEQAS